MALLGVAYKGGVSDVRESPALRIIELLKERRAAVSYHDPHVPELADFGLASVPLDEIAAADAVVLVTAHPGVDEAAIARAASLFVDLRGRTRGVRRTSSSSERPVVTAAGSSRDRARRAI